MSSLPLHASINQGGKVKIVCGYALQQRLGSGSFATVYKGVKVSSSSSTTSSLTVGNTSSSSPSSSSSSLPSNALSAGSSSSSSTGSITITKRTADVVAIKAITRTSEKLTKKVLENLELEISILRTYRHPNIVCMQEVQKTERHFYLILEYCGGGDLQRLIRTRRVGRISERLARRLMRDLSAGLKFLWTQELIHRDIKPQNLLLTGPLPLDEKNDPAKMAIHEEMRQEANFPSDHFALKIADFGFARHLQTSSLAETLCGSPLYMAPEILQHHRYDAKADLWSVGTVLFEMVAGKPPFNGENHIDLLRNIQRKAVRLPTDVRVSKECVNLLRILLNRNPLSRAGFSQFLEACEAFVGLGCEGVELQLQQQQQQQEQQVSRQSSIKMMDLGTIHEDNKGAKPLQQQQQQQHHQQQQPSHNNNDRALARSPSSAQQQQQQQQQHQQGYVTPPFGPLPTPQFSRPMSPLEEQLTVAPQLQTQMQYQSVNPRFAPLQPSPPQSGNHHLIPPSAQVVLTSPSIPNLDASNISRHGQIQLTTFHHHSSHPVENASQNSNDDSEFVMVEHHASTSRHVGRSQQRSHGGSQRYGHSGTGILSTSPGTGGMLVGLMKMGSRSRLVHRHNSSGGSSCSSVVTSNPSPISSIDSEIESAANMVAASEDVGRRAISVAHLGDTRAYLSMRHLVNLANSTGSSLLSAAMEGVEEEGKNDGDEHSAANITDYGEDEASSHSKSVTNRRRLSSASDKIMMEAAKINDDENDDDNENEMPFAMPADQINKVSSVPIPSRPGSESYYNKKNATIVPSVAKSSAHLVRICLREALSCYLKALSMIKSVLNAVQKARKDLEGLKQQQQQQHQRGGIGGTLTSMMVMTPDRASRIDRLLKRCSMTGNWLSGQFTGVLERADAANGEINKLAPPSAASSTAEKSPRGSDDNKPSVTSVNELIYNHALACGRDAAVKQLLGQYNTSRSCYRTAGLLVEILLMEPNIGADDKKILEGYVNGFSTRIHKLDTLIRQEAASSQQHTSTQQRQQHNINSELIGSSIGTSSKARGGVIGIIGGIPPISTPGLAAAENLSIQ